MKRPLPHLVLLCLMVALGAAGCADVDSPTDEGPSPLVSTDSGSLQLAYGPPDALPADSLYPDSVASEGMRVIDEVQAFDSVAASASDWRVADRNIRARLGDSSAIPGVIREQAAAHAMLLHYFGDDALAPDQREALRFYVDLLLDHRSPASPLIYPALQALRPDWSTPRLTAAIDTTLRATRTTYRVNPNGVEPHIPDVHSRIRIANKALEAMRDSLQSG